MKIVMVSFVTGIIAAFIMAVCAFIQKKAGERALYGAGGLLIILSYAAGHLLLSGIPPVFERGFNMPADHWNLLIALAAFIPFVAAEYIFKLDLLKYIVRFAFVFSGLFLVLQVPYITTSWTPLTSLIVLGGISLAAVILLLGSGMSSALGDNRVNYPMMLMVPLSATAVLGMSSTISLSVLSAQVFAAAAALVVISFILPKLKLQAPRLAMKEVLGVIYIMVLFFLLEGYFFADVRMASLILTAGSMAVPGIAGMISAPGDGVKMGGRPVFISVAIAGLMNLISIATALVMNG